MAAPKAEELQVGDVIAIPSRTGDTTRLLQVQKLTKSNIHWRRIGEVGKWTDGTWSRKSWDHQLRWLASLPQGETT